MIWAIIVGLIVGAIAKFLMPGNDPGGIIVTMLLGIGGAALLMSAGQELTLTGDSALGDFLIFLNAASYAIYLVIIKPLMLRYRPIIVIRWVFLFGFVFVLPFGLPQFLAIDWSLFTWLDYTGVAFIVVCVTFFTYLWNIFALKHLSPATAGAYIYLQPIFAAVISVLFTGENLTPVKIVATLLIFLGVYLVNFSGLKTRREPQAGTTESGSTDV